MTIDTEIDALAAHLAKEAARSGEGAPSFAEKTEALKILTAYRAMLVKRKLGTSEEDEEAPNFENFGREIKEAENGQVATRSNRGRARHG